MPVPTATQSAGWVAGTTKATGSRKYADLDSFRALEEPHRQVHESGRAALACGAEGDYRGMLQHLEEMEASSLRVITCIDRLKQDVARQQSSTD